MVDSQYPGAQLFLDQPPAYIIVNDPRPGRWSAVAEGQDVPEGTTNFSLVGSVRAREGGGPQPGLRVLMTLLALAAVVVYMTSRGPSGVSGQSAEVALYRLEILSGERVIRVMTFDKQWVTVGRGGDCDITIADPRASRTHAVIRRNGTNLTMQDAGSANGTRVNGLPVSRSVLRPGDVIEIGDTQLRYAGLLSR